MRRQSIAGSLTRDELGKFWFPCHSYYCKFFSAPLRNPKSKILRPIKPFFRFSEANETYMHRRQDILFFYQHRKGLIWYGESATMEHKYFHDDKQNFTKIQMPLVYWITKHQQVPKLKSLFQVSKIFCKK